MERHYYSFNEYLRERFGLPVRRISLNAGFGCPNRDGTLSSAGCIFCNERGFTNFPDANLPLAEQIKVSIELSRKRFKAERFIAYFQNATNTYAPPGDLKKAYDTIRQFPEIVGLSISTRPDCVDKERLGLIESYTRDYEVWVEYGLQTVHDRTLEAINRSHTFSQFADAVNLTSGRGIKISAHVILGLPGESGADMAETASTISSMPVSGVKLHVFHVMRGTRLEEIYKKGGIMLLEEKEYAGLACDFMERLRPDCVIMRLVSNARDEVLVAPGWVNNKGAVLDSIEREFKRRSTRQGAKYGAKEGRKAAVA